MHTSEADAALLSVLVKPMAQTARLLPAATQVIDAAPVTGVHGVHASDVPAAELSVLKYPALHAATRLLPMVLQATESAFATGVHGNSQQSGLGSDLRHVHTPSVLALWVQPIFHGP